jgi:hypothetical protein
MAYDALGRFASWRLENPPTLAMPQRPAADTTTPEQQMWTPAQAEGAAPDSAPPSGSVTSPSPSGG